MTIRRQRFMVTSMGGHSSFKMASELISSRSIWQIRMNHRLFGKILLWTWFLSLRLAAGPVFEPLHGFEPGPKESYGVCGPLIAASNSWYYGATPKSGSVGNGEIFRVKPTGEFEVVIQFTGNSGVYPGSNPIGGLVRAGDGNLYGVTSFGGPNSGGTIFRLTEDGELTTLATFTGGPNHLPGYPVPLPPRVPAGPLVVGDDGNLYGTTKFGGLGDNGSVFRISLGGTLTFLATFTGSSGSLPGMFPASRLIDGGDGNLYGITTQGGTGNNGVIFRVSIDGSVATIAHVSSFGSGREVVGGLSLGDDGMLYGTTSDGGNFSRGTLFRVSLTGTGETIHHFLNGIRPLTTLVKNNEGILFGTCSWSNSVYQVNLDGMVSQFKSLTGGGIRYPDGDLTIRPDGSLMAVCAEGGVSGVGGIYVLPPNGDPEFVHEFVNHENFGGERPVGGLASHPNGMLFGTTYEGGKNGAGTLYRIDPFGQLETLISFDHRGVDDRGAHPSADLMVASNGTIWGTTEEGGVTGDGTVFSMTADGDLTSHVDFSDNGESFRGGSPMGRLVEDINDGSIYGVTWRGATNSSGTVFRLTSGGDFSTLVEFQSPGLEGDGRNPIAGMVFGSDGRLYGTTHNGGTSQHFGTVFALAEGGALETLHSFTSFTAGGQYPFGGLTWMPDGYFWGTTSGGSKVFKIRSGEAIQLVGALNNAATPRQGSSPLATLTPGVDGRLYGLAYEGGELGLGTVFAVDGAGAVELVAAFSGTSGQAPGANPTRGALVQHLDGNLYGVTPTGGVKSDGSPAGKGQIFRIRFGPSPKTEIPTGNAGGAAVLHGAVNPNGTETTAAFELSGSPDMSDAIRLGTQPVGSGNAVMETQVSVADLTLGVPYYYRQVASNGDNPIEQKGQVQRLVSLHTPETWRNSHFGFSEPSGIAADLYDADWDGLVNLLEFVLGLDPRGSQSMPVKVLPPVAEGGAFVVEFPLAKAAAAAGYDLLVEWSDSLETSDWSSVDASSPQIVGDDGIVYLFRVELPTGPLGRRFVRLRVVVNSVP